MSVSDRIIVIRAGEIVELGTPQQLYRNPQSLFTMNFVGESNFLEGLITDNSSSDKVRVSFRNNQSLWLSNGVLDFDEGESVVVAFRPENVTITADTISNALEGEITAKQFIGGYNRYTASLITEDNVILDSRKDISLKEKVFIELNSKETRVFHAPEFGLKKVLTLE